MDIIKYSDLFDEQGLNSGLTNLIGQITKVRTELQGMIKEIKGSATDLSKALSNTSSSTKNGRDDTNKQAEKVEKLYAAYMQLGLGVKYCEDNIKNATTALEKINRASKLLTVSNDSAEKALQRLKAQASLVQIALEDLSASNQTSTQNSQNLATTLATLTEQILHFEKATKGANASTKGLSKEMNPQQKEVVDLQKSYSSLSVLIEETGVNIEQLLLTEKQQSIATKNGVIANNSLSGSYNQLYAQYNLVKNVLNAMSDEMRKAEGVGKKWEAEALRMMNAMKSMQEATGKHTLSVGDYSKALNGLNIATTQVLREVPVLANSFQQFLVAISNNIPIFVDQLTAVKNATGSWAVAMRAVLAVLFSWQTALLLVLTILPMIIKPLTANISLFQDKNKVLQKSLELYQELISIYKSLNEQIVRNNREENESLRHNIKLLKLRKSSLEEVQDAEKKALEARKNLHKEQAKTFESVTFGRNALKDYKQNLAILDELRSKYRSLSESANLNKKSNGELRKSDKKSLETLKKRIDTYDALVRVAEEYFDEERALTEAETEMIKRHEEEKYALYKKEQSLIRENASLAISLTSDRYQKQREIAIHETDAMITDIQDILNKAPEWLSDTQIKEYEEKIKLLREILIQNLQKIDREEEETIIAMRNENTILNLSLMKDGMNKELKLRKEKTDQEREEIARELLYNKELTLDEQEALREKMKKLFEKGRLEDNEIRLKYAQRDLRISTDLQLAKVDKEVKNETKANIKKLDIQIKYWEDYLTNIKTYGNLAESEMVAVETEVQTKILSLQTSRIKEVHKLVTSDNSFLIKLQNENEKARLSLLRDGMEKELKISKENTRQQIQEVKRLMKSKNDLTIEEKRELEKKIQLLTEQGLLDENAITLKYTQDRLRVESDLEIARIRSREKNERKANLLILEEQVAYWDKYLENIKTLGNLSEEEYEKVSNSVLATILELKNAIAKESIILAFEVKKDSKMEVVYQNILDARHKLDNSIKEGSIKAQREDADAYKNALKEKAKADAEFAKEHIDTLLSLGQISKAEYNEQLNNIETNYQRTIENLTKKRKKKFNLWEQLFGETKYDEKGNLFKELSEEAQMFIGAFEESMSMAFDYMNEWIDKRMEMADVAIEAAQKESEAAKTALDYEMEARANGYANNVSLARQEYEEKLAVEQEAIREKERLAKVQEGIDSAMQLSSLITAAAELWASHASIPVAGPALAIAATALMFGSFAASKIQAFQASRAKAYGQGGSEYINYGGSHASGKDVDFGRTKDGRPRRIERGEIVGIINKKNVEKYGVRNIENIINSLNKGTFERDYEHDSTASILDMFRTDSSSISSFTSEDNVLTLLTAMESGKPISFEELALIMAIKALETKKAEKKKAEAENKSIITTTNSEERSLFKLDESNKISKMNMSDIILMDSLTREHLLSSRSEESNSDSVARMMQTLASSLSEEKSYNLVSDSSVLEDSIVTRLSDKLHSTFEMVDAYEVSNSLEDKEYSKAYESIISALSTERYNEMLSNSISSEEFVKKLRDEIIMTTLRSEANKTAILSEMFTDDSLVSKVSKDVLKTIFVGKESNIQSMEKESYAKRVFGDVLKSTNSVNEYNSEKNKELSDTIKKSTMSSIFDSILHHSDVVESTKFNTISDMYSTAFDTTNLLGGDIDLSNIEKGLNTLIGQNDLKVVETPYGRIEYRGNNKRIIRNS